MVSSWTRSVEGWTISRDPIVWCALRPVSPWLSRWSRMRTEQDEARTPRLRFAMVAQKPCRNIEKHTTHGLNWDCSIFIFRISSWPKPSGMTLEVWSFCVCSLAEKSRTSSWNTLNLRVLLWPVLLWPLVPETRCPIASWESQTGPFYIHIIYISTVYNIVSFAEFPPRSSVQGGYANI